MHAPINRKTQQVHKSVKREKKERTVFNKELLKPDVDFVDERKVRKVRKEENKGFFAKLFH